PLPAGSGNPVADAFTRIGHTIRDAKRYRILFRMLLAFWFYSEGIGAIILLATAYGAALGLSTAVLIGTLLMTQFVACPYALIYGRIPHPESKARSAFVSMLVWTGITLPLLGLYANLTNIDVAFGLALIVGDQLLGVLFAVLVGRRLFQPLAEKL